MQYVKLHLEERQEPWVKTISLFTSVYLRCEQRDSGGGKQCWGQLASQTLCPFKIIICQGKEDYHTVSFKFQGNK